MMGKRGGIWAEVNEDVSVPDVGMNTIEGIVFAAEAVVGVRSSDQTAVEAVGPPVIRAGKVTRAAATAIGDTGAAVAADIEKGPKLPSARRTSRIGMPA